MPKIEKHFMTPSGNLIPSKKLREFVDELIQNEDLTEWISDHLRERTMTRTQALEATIATLWQEIERARDEIAAYKIMSEHDLASGKTAPGSDEEQ